MRKQSRKGRSVHETWSKGQTMQQWRMHKHSSKGRSVQKAWRKDQTRCSSEGCTNKVVKGGVCTRHGAYLNPTDESTAFASYFGSAFSKTTATHPNQSNVSASVNQGSLPAEVVVCGVIAENYEEV